MKQVKTAKGKVLNMQAMYDANQTTQAVGNANMNARGDVLGPGGKVVQSREEVTREYYKNNPKAAVKTVSIKDAVDSKPVVDQSQTIVEKKTTSKTKAKAKATKEVELPNGDIEIQEVEE